jgi:hypothetical protein
MPARTQDSRLDHALVNHKADLTGIDSFARDDCGTKQHGDPRTRNKGVFHKPTVLIFVKD